MLNGLGICSGIGGLECSLESWVRWIAHCEREPYPAAVLLGKTGVPCWDEVATFPWSDFKGIVDIVAAGFPCQDVSEVGNHAGMDGKRSTLVFDIIRGCAEIETEFIFLENVPPVTKKMGWQIVRELTRYGYDARWLRLFVPTECPIGEGQRWFLLAKAKSQSRDETDQKDDTLRNQTDSRWWRRSWKTNCLPGWDKMPNLIGKYLHAGFYETLMGFPEGWTLLEPWVMPWYQSKRGKRSKS